MKSRLSILAFSFLVACSTSPKTSQDSIDLGRRLASDSRDWRAHRDLAKLRLAEGVWGEALREYLIVERQGKLAGQDREALGNLLVARAKKRTELADPAALEDLEHAARLGVAAPEQMPAALALAAVSELRHSSTFTMKRAKGHLTRLAEFAPKDPRTQQESLSSLQQDELVVLLAWFQKAGAKRQALRVAEHYVQSGGRDAQVVDQWLELHRWWYGKRRPPLPTEVAATGAKALPPLARFQSELQSEPVLLVSSAARAIVEEWKLELWAETIEEIEEAYAQEPARAHSLVRVFVDQSVHGAARMAVVAELYQRLGNPARAKVWARELAALSPGMPSYSLAAGLACALDGDLGPAEQYFVSAAAASGDPGRYWGIAAKALRRAGHPLASLSAHRRALELTAAGRDLDLLFDLSLAQRALGRDQDAAQTVEGLVGRLAEAEHAEAKLLMEQSVRQEAESTQAWPLFLGVIQEELGF